MFLIKLLLVHLSRRLTCELIAYIRRHPASTRRRLSVNINKHVILRYLRIKSLDLSDIRSHPILCACLRFLQVSNELDQKTTKKKWRHHNRSDSLTNHYVRKFIARHSFVFVSIHTVQEVLRILETCS